MPKEKTLRGLPGNLAQSYLSTLSHYDGGYMGDWIYSIALTKEIKEIEVDILGKSIFPKEAELKPLLAYLDKLISIVEKELEENGFKFSFIKKAVLRFEIPFDDKTYQTRTIYCFPSVVDINGKTYKPKKRIIELCDSKFDPNKISKYETKI
jgi:hypothetical protein